MIAIRLGRPGVRDVTLDDADAVFPNPLPQHGSNCFLAWSLEAGFGTGVHRQLQACREAAGETGEWVVGL